ncbi:MAG: trigger factor [Prochloraceae cyanobacterium]
MKITQEKLPASQIGLEIEISAETSQKTYEKVVQNLARTVNVPGFRKGKVPRQILVQRLGSQRIKAAALEEIIQKTLEEAVKQESIDSLGNYQLRSNFDELLAQYKPGETLTFSASVDVPPTVELGEEYKNLSVKAEETTYDPTEVDKFLEQRRQEQATLVPVEERPAQMGDVVVVDYQGRSPAAEGEEGEEISGTQAKDFQVELEEGRFIEGMVEGIVGMRPEETKKVAVTFPEDYPREDLANQPAIFTISLKEIKEKELPELDDDFAQEASEFETMAQFRESLETQFQEKAEKETKNSINEAIIKQLVQVASLELPETMIKEEVDAMLTQTAMQMQQMGIDVNQLFTAESVPQMRERSRPEAIVRLKQDRILKEIGKRESLEVESEAIEAKITEIQEQLSDQQLDLDRLQTLVQEDLLKEKTLDWLRERANVELVPKGTLSESQDEQAQQEEESEATEAANSESSEG